MGVLVILGGLNVSIYGFEVVLFQFSFLVCNFPSYLFSFSPSCIFMIYTYFLFSLFCPPPFLITLMHFTSVLLSFPAYLTLCSQSCQFVVHSFLSVCLYLSVSRCFYVLKLLFCPFHSHFRFAFWPQTPCGFLLLHKLGHTVYLWKIQVCRCCMLHKNHIKLFCNMDILHKRPTAQF